MSLSRREPNAPLVDGTTIILRGGPTFAGSVRLHYTAPIASLTRVVVGLLSIRR